MSPSDYEPKDSPPIPDSRKSVSVSLDNDLVQLLDKLAQSQRVSRSEIANQLLGLAATEREKIQAEQEEKKVTISVRVKKSHAEHLKELAKIEGKSINFVVAQLIESAMKARMDAATIAAVEVLQEQLQEVIEAQRIEIEKQMHRHAHLISRSVLENLQNRQMMLAILQAQGIANEDIQKLSEVALHRSIDQLKNAKPMMREALRDLLGHDLVVVNAAELAEQNTDEDEEDIEQYEEEDAEQYEKNTKGYLMKLYSEADSVMRELENYRDVYEAYDMPEYQYLKDKEQMIEGKIAEVRVKLYELKNREPDDDDEYEDDDYEDENEDEE